MAKVEVVNLSGNNQEYDVYIGHAVRWRGLGKSPWRNPFAWRMHRGEITREHCLKLFEEYIERHPELIDALERAVDEHGGRLGCWCAPEPCHGHILAAKLEERKAVVS